MHAPLDATPIACAFLATTEGLIRSFAESHTASFSVFQQPKEKKKERPLHVKLVHSTLNS
jgi:hypothetical protein